MAVGVAKHSCVKSGRQCVSCLPARNSYCSNKGILTSVNSEQTSSIIQDPSDTVLESAINVVITVDLTSPPSLPMPLTPWQTSPTTRNLPDVHTTRDPSDAILDSSSSVSLTTVDRTPQPSLPTFKPVLPQLHKGNLSGQEFSNALDNAYSLTVHSRPNLFKVPSGSSGKHFVCELARPFEAFTTESALQSFAMTAAMTFPALMLQKPHAKSKTCDHISCLQRRLASWEKGDIAELLKEGKAIQRSMRASVSSRSNAKDDTTTAHKFSQVMMEGRIRTTLQLLTKET